RSHREQQEREARAEGGDGVLDAVWTAADVEEDDRDEGKESELRADPGAHVAVAALIWSGRLDSHSSKGVSRSTTISILPLGIVRTRPFPVPRGMTSFSRWMPRASVTAKMRLISFMPTASSIAP